MERQKWINRCAFQAAILCETIRGKQRITASGQTGIERDIALRDGFWRSVDDLHADMEILEEITRVRFHIRPLCDVVSKCAGQRILQGLVHVRFLSARSFISVMPNAQCLGIQRPPLTHLHL